MMITWGQIIALLPILIIGTTIVIIMLSISYNRNQFKHAMFTIVGLILSGLSALSVIWKHQGTQHVTQLIYIDNFSVLYTVLILIASVASSILVYRWLLYYPTDRRDEFYLLLLLSSMGGVILTITDHLVMLFLGIELISLPLFGLVGYSVFQKSSIESSIKYIILSGISSSFFLFGIALIYAETSCLSFSGIKEILLICNNDYRNNVLQQSMLLQVTGLMMMMVGFSFKLSLVPFHLWIPDVYQSSSVSVSMYLATSSKIAIISVLIRFLLILPNQYYQIFYIFLSGSACCSMLFGSIMATQQNNIKRILAYSSITNSGYLLVALITPNENLLITQEVIGIYLISYLFSSIGAFGIVNIITTFDNKSDTLSVYRGLFWREPILSIVFTIIILSLAGLPITLGFIGKFYLLLIGISNKLWLFIIIMIISSVISMLYYLKIIINLYVSPIQHYNFDCNYTGNWCYSPNGIMIILSSVVVLVFGLYPQPMINLIYFMCMD